MRTRHWVVSISIAAVLFVAIAIFIAGNQGASLPAKAGSPYQTVLDVQPSSKMTDAISVALNAAKAGGLSTDPDDMQIAKGTYWEFMPPGTLDSVYKDRSVIVVQIKATFLFNGPGVSDMPVNYLYIYIDEKTGMPFETVACTQSIQSFDHKTWVKVSKNHVGKFPIPDFASSKGVGGDFLGPTPTLVKD